MSTLVNVLQFCDTGDTTSVFQFIIFIVPTSSLKTQGLKDTELTCLRYAGVKLCVSLWANFLDPRLFHVRGRSVEENIRI